MVRSYLFPMLKRFKGPFFSMAFISMLAIAMMVGLFGALGNLESSYDAFKSDYGSPSVSYYMDLSKDEAIAGVAEVEGVGKVETRLRFDAYLRREDGRPLIARIFTFEDEREGIVKPCFGDIAAKREDMVNVAVSTALAKSNGISVGNDIELGFGETYAKFHVYAIYDHATAIYIRPSPFIASDNRDFGHIMIARSEAKKAEECIIEPYMETHDSFVPPEGTYDPTAVLEAMADVTGNPERIDHYFTELLIQKKNGYGEEEVNQRVSAFLKGKVNVLETITESHSLYEQFISHVDRQFHTAGLFLPIFFFAVSLAIIALFLIQIIKLMTRDIGTMLSVGVSHGQVLGLLSVCTLAVMGISALFGIGLGSAIMAVLVNIFRASYFMPGITFGLDPLATLIAILIAAGISQIAVLIAAHNIFSITPKDAMISNEAKRRKLPKSMEKGIDRMPLYLRMAANATFQNPRRSIVSCFAILASTTMIIIAGLFGVSINTTIHQTTQTRLNYDAQVYCTKAEEDDAFLKDLQAQPCVTKAEQGYFTWLEATHGDKKTTIEVVGVDVESQSLQYIPDFGANGRLYVEEEGMILPAYSAELLGVGVGDLINFGTRQIKVTAISTQHMHFVGYLSMAKVKELSHPYVSTYFVNVSDEASLMSYVSMHKIGSVVVNTSSYRADLKERHDPINFVVWVITGFSLAMALATLTITAQDQLIDQKKPLSILRCVGYGTKDISNIWSIQRAFEFLIAGAIACPAAYLTLKLILKGAASEEANYPVLADYRWFILGLFFVLIVLGVAHLLSMRKISKWNLADNTRSRE